jgi:hypothetical protein
VADANPKIESFLTSKELSLKYSSAIALINLKNPKVIPVVNEIFDLNTHKNFTPEQIAGLKLNALSEIQKVRWVEFKNKVDYLSKNEQNLMVKAKALEFLNQLNN